MRDLPPRTVAHEPIEVQWLEHQSFEIGRSTGPKVRIDGAAESAPSPFDVLLGAIATCASVDVLSILGKQRTPAASLNVRIEATRIAATPRRLAAATLHFSIAAPGTTLAKATRAVELSVTKYCSVRASLIAEAPVSWTVVLEG